MQHPCQTPQLTRYPPKYRNGIASFFDFTFKKRVALPQRI